MIPLNDLVTEVTKLGNILAVLLGLLFMLVWMRWPGWKRTPVGRTTFMLVIALEVIGIAAIFRRFDKHDLANLFLAFAWPITAAILWYLLIDLLSGKPPDYISVDTKRDTTKDSTDGESRFL